MNQAEKNLRLKELNKECERCRHDFIKEGFEPPSGRACLQSCKIGKEIHNLDDQSWDQQDWNSSKLKDLYHQ